MNEAVRLLREVQSKLDELKLKDNVVHMERLVHALALSADTWRIVREGWMIEEKRRKDHT